LYPSQKFECPPFGMIVGTGLKLWHRGNFQWHDLLSEFHKNILIVSKVDGRGDRHTDRNVIA
jgi:hypothetical protein